MNSRNGKIAIKKLKDILPALAVSAPLTIPKKYISIKSKREKPLNPGNWTESRSSTKGFINQFFFNSFAKIILF